MRCIRILVLCGILLSAACATAQVDVFTICADDEAVETCGGNIDLPVFTQRRIHLCLVNPTGQTVLAWEANIQHDGEPGAFVGNWTLVAGLNVGSGNNFIVGLGASPLHSNAEGIIELMYMNVLLLNNNPVEFFIDGVSGSASLPPHTPGYQAILGIITPGVIGSGSYELPVFSINGDVTPPPDDPSVVGFDVLVEAHRGIYSDLNNHAGADPTATDGFDATFDNPEPPAPVGDALSLWFDHPEWASPLGERFRTDIRATYNMVGSTKGWDFVVTGDMSGETRLEFTPSFEPGPTIGLYLLDVTVGVVTELWPDGVYTYEDPPFTERRFRLLAGQRTLPPFVIQSRDLGTGWSLVGQPLIPSPGETLQEVFWDDAPGPLYVYDYAGPDGYEARIPADPFEIGMGYWVATMVGFDWNGTGSPPGVDVEVPLNEGWTLLGNPLWFDSNLAAVRVVHDGSSYTYGEAVNAGLVSPWVYGYDPALDDYVTTNSLAPWHGYWASAYAPGISLYFTPDQMSKSAPADALPWPPPAEEGWRLTVAADGLGRRIELGRTFSATDAFDVRLDRPQPPAAPTAKDADFWLDGEAYGLSTGRRLSADLRALGTEAVSWDAVLRLDEPGSVTLSWDDSQWSGDEDLQIYLPQQNREVLRSMRSARSVTLAVGAEPLIVRFRTPDLTTDTPDARTGFRLSAAPNPFNPRTEITAFVSQDGPAELRFFDVQGRLVHRQDLGEGMSGTYRIEWNGRDDRGREVPSGSYFAALYLDGASTGAVIKMSLVR